MKFYDQFWHWISAADKPAWWISFPFHPFRVTHNVTGTNRLYGVGEAIKVFTLQVGWNASSSTFCMRKHLLNRLELAHNEHV